MTRISSKHIVPLAGFVSALSACAATPAPRFVRAADLDKIAPISLDRPLVVEFEKGDTLPLRFKLDGPFLKTPDEAPLLSLRVVRHFYLRIDKSGLRASTNGKDFDSKPATPGRFRAGFGVVDGKTISEISISTPVPAGLASSR